MNRAARRERAFPGDEACAFFLDRVAELPERDGTRVHAFALMPNHFHLLLTAGREGLGPALKHVQSHYSRWLNARYHWDGPVWRSRFKSRRVDSEDYWRHLLAYTHRNPVEAGLAPTVAAARWTSHHAYVDPDHAPAWLFTAEHLELYGSVRAYLDYLQDLDQGYDVAPDGFDPQRLGREDRRNQPTAVERPPPPQTPPEHWPMSRDAAWVAYVLTTGRSRQEVLEEGPGSRNNPRWWLALWWLPRACGATDKQIADELGVHASAITRARQRLDQRVLEDERLERWMRRLADLLPSS